jgi:hypothetical protein
LFLYGDLRRVVRECKGEKIKHNANHNAVVNSEVGGTNLATVVLDWNISILEAF